jgi:hypothetical protein
VLGYAAGKLSMFVATDRDCVTIVSHPRHVGEHCDLRETSTRVVSQVSAEYGIRILSRCSSIVVEQETTES